MFIYLIQLASVSIRTHTTLTTAFTVGWTYQLSRPNSTDNSPARYGLCNPLRLSCVLGATPERIGFEIFEDQCSNWHDLFLTQMSPFFVTLLYGDASFGRAGNDDDDQHNKLPSQAKSKIFLFFLNIFIQEKYTTRSETEVKVASWCNTYKYMYTMTRWICS